MTDWLITIKTARLPKLEQGNHSNVNTGLCAMEMVAFMEGLPHSDEPECTDPGIARYVQVGNDRMSDDLRQTLLLPLIPRLAGTNNPEYAQARAEHFALAAVRRFAPVVCRGKIADELVDAMTGASTLAGARAAARAAAACAARAAAAAVRAGARIDAARAARAAADARAAATAAADARAARAAAAAADAAAYSGLWSLYIDVLIEAIELDPACREAKTYLPARVAQLEALA